MQHGSAVRLKAIHAGNFLNKKYCQPRFPVHIRTRFKSFLSWLSIVIFYLFLSDFVWSNSWMKGIVGPFGNYACWFSLWELDWNNRWCLNATNHNQQQNNLALRWKISLRISSPQEERQALKPTFSVAKPCNYNVTWCTGAKNAFSFKLRNNPCEMAHFTVIIWAIWSDDIWKVKTYLKIK